MMGRQPGSVRGTYVEGELTMRSTDWSAGAVDQGLDVVVVGAGFAGIHVLHSLKQRGFRVRVLEAADSVGGTWYHNRYPGARCDIESLDYSYSFSDDLQQEWHWSERYASQQEIKSYLDHVVDRFGLRPDIELSSTVTSAVYDELTATWTVRSAAGATYQARYCILATGVLSAAQVPRIDGADTFRGRSYHTTDWPQEAPSFAGCRIGVIGTGSSATQLIPIVAGPQSPSVFSNMVTSIEQHGEWITDCIDHLERNGLSSIEATMQAESSWVDHVNESAERTLYGRSRHTWFWGANTPGKPRVFLPYIGGVAVYGEKLNQVRANGYEGTVLTRLPPLGCGPPLCG